MKDIKEAPLNKYIWIYLDSIYGIMKYKGIIKCDDNGIDVYPYVIINPLGKDKEFECMISFKGISGWDYLQNEIS